MSKIKLLKKGTQVIIVNDKRKLKNHNDIAAGKIGKILDVDKEDPDGLAYYIGIPYFLAMSVHKSFLIFCFPIIRPMRTFFIENGSI